MYSCFQKLEIVFVLEKIVSVLEKISSWNNSKEKKKK